MDPDVDDALDRLDAYSANGSWLVSMYAPPERLIDEAIVLLDDEHTKADGIQSEDRRETVQQALVRLQDELASYDRPPKTEWRCSVGDSTMRGSKKRLNHRRGRLSSSSTGVTEHFS